MDMSDQQLAEGISAERIIEIIKYVETAEPKIETK